MFENFFDYIRSMGNPGGFRENPSGALSMPRPQEQPAQTPGWVQVLQEYSNNFNQQRMAQPMPQHPTAPPPQAQNMPPPMYQMFAQGGNPLTTMPFQSMFGPGQAFNPLTQSVRGGFR